MKKIAIFDIDGTVFRSSLLIELVEELITEGVFPQNARRNYQLKWVNWQNRKGDYETYIDAVVDSFMENIKGVAFDDFNRVAKSVASRLLDRNYVYTSDLVRKFKKQGYFLAAISQSPKGILDLFAKKLGFDKIYGRFYELGPSDRFTGEVEDLHLISNKANIVKRILEKEKLSLSGSIGVGDTEGDISFLEMVENPICFNPNKKLYRHAKLNGWKVVVERKDVVYEILN